VLTTLVNSTKIRQVVDSRAAAGRTAGGAAMNERSTYVLVLLATVFAAWAGLVLGVSFLSARAKFRAPSITPRVALDVGRQTFRMLSRTEMVLALGASLACMAAPSTLIAAGMAMVWVLIAAERLWLLPILDLRAGIRMTGRVPASSHHHALFARLELAKALLLFVCSGVVTLTLAAR
jgi:hypothetical protein